MRAALTLDTVAVLVALTNHLTATKSSRSKVDQQKLAAVAYSLGEAHAVLELAGVRSFDVQLQDVVRRVEISVVD